LRANAVLARAAETLDRSNESGKLFLSRCPL
jgi:hypothetical protein